MSKESNYKVKQTTTNNVTFKNVEKLEPSTEPLSRSISPQDRRRSQSPYLSVSYRSKIIMLDFRNLVSN